MSADEGSDDGWDVGEPDSAAADADGVMAAISSKLRIITNKVVPSVLNTSSVLIIVTVIFFLFHMRVHVPIPLFRPWLEQTSIIVIIIIIIKCYYCYYYFLPSVVSRAIN